jgi:hypothetical protein
MTAQEFETSMAAFAADLKEAYADISDNASYYVFQTSYHYAPDIIIVGLNPGANFEGGKNLVNPIVAELEHHSMYIDRQAGNRWFQRICSIFGYPDNEYLKKKFETAVGTNLIYSNTGNADKLNGLNDKAKVIEIGRTFTKRLIDEIIHPQAIVTLSNDAFGALNTIKQKKLYRIKGDMPYHLTVGARLIEGKNIPILKVPNPSGRNNHCFKGDLTHGWTLAIEQALKESITTT